jgi:hypothetical protein
MKKFVKGKKKGKSRPSRKEVKMMIDAFAPPKGGKDGKNNTRN